MSEMFPIEQLSFAEIYNHCTNFQMHQWGMCKDIKYENDIAEEELFFQKTLQKQTAELFSEFKGFDHSFGEIKCTPLEQCHKVRKVSGGQRKAHEEPVKEEATWTIPLAGLEILNNYGSRVSLSRSEKEIASSYDIAQTQVGVRQLTTDGILRLAGEKFIRSCSPRNVNLSLLVGPISSSFPCLADEEINDVELVQILLMSAEKVGKQQYDCASKLLDLCDGMSSAEGNPVQRLVYYFLKALREKIFNETGVIPSNCLDIKQSFDVKEALMSPTPTVISFHKEVPFSQVNQFIGVQVIVENVGEAKRVHIIDLEIRSGLQCMVLMQALGSQRRSPLEHFKVTAIGIKSKEKIEETGRRLTTFALSMNIPFSFNVIMVADMLALSKNHFMLDPKEVVAVVSSYYLWTLLAVPNQLECLMGIIRKINPCVMIITEIEAKHNSPVFVNRFIEALFYYGVFFDAVEDCMGPENPNRLITESMFLNQGIRTVVAAEKEERTIRHVNIAVWRAFFARFRMVEKELSSSSLYQADLVLKNFACGNSCTLARDEKGLIIGWKGTPVHSLTTWKFL
ncbi:GRAS transcription factor [Heracleum sosnowskyi]|uniref:GRAS transcription factor n=1 Tax=Heracleum sosnowskyi TaxID=360622 RepID=A0AAD8IKN0_9APIA|nr:GRAS transcription factor [Heracleum sosnowskyi]